MGPLQFWSFFIAPLPIIVIPLMPSWRWFIAASIGGVLLVSWLFYRAQTESCAAGCGEAFVVVPMLALCAVLVLAAIVGKAMALRSRRK